jgi:Concanavalin A-like lectin/glucanases superfamily
LSTCGFEGVIALALASVGCLDYSALNPCLDRPCHDGAAGSSGYREVVLADSPLAYWRLGEGGGATVARDEQGAHDGAYRGGVTLGQPGALVGDADTSAAFGGVDGLVSIPNGGLPEGGASFSLEAWTYCVGNSRTGAIGYGTIMGSGADLNHRLLYNTGNGQLLTQFDGDFHSTTNASPVLNAWHHVVYTFDSSASTERLYLDGGLAGAHTTTLPTWNASFDLGAYDAADYMWNGRLDEVAIYGTALSPGRVAAHFGAGSQ